ncbi:MAG: N-acetylmuramoyl-L-alanine amidase [Candidatus Omnitrophica bacterium]|nr:N-acetylmuramoyl-L-alanine amidase [Candidatus Omnitrophota bacterium]
MSLRILICFLLILTLHGCGGRPVIKPAPVVGIALQDVCDRYHVSWQWDGVTQVVMLEYKGNKAKALVGSQTVLLGKEKIILSSPLRREHSTIYVPEDFEAKVIAPFGVTISGLPPVEVASRVHTIVIDAGHGGKDHGTIGFGMNEKDLVLDIAKRIRGLLDGTGIKVILTRDTDEFISLAGRTEVAARCGADLFVSIHVNSNQDKAVNGLLVYYIGNMEKKYLNELQRKNNERVFTQRMNSQAGTTLQAIVADMMEVLKTSQSQRFAKMIVREARQEGRISVRGDGIRLCHFFVVRNTLIPAVLVETGFLSNHQDRSKLSLPEYRQKIAEIIARGVLDYAND